MVRKKARLSIHIDMTPMVDVIMLLLTFFMMTTQFKPEEAVDVTLPFSHSEFELPQSDVMTVWVSNTNQIFLGVDSPILRAELFGEEYRNKLGAQIEDKNTLADIMIKARLKNPKLRTVVKADKDTQYGQVQDIMDILQRIKITRFALVTELEQG